MATVDADPFLVAAARTGVILTCVTQARRLGLWVLRDERPHVAAAAHAGHVSADAVIHWHAPTIPRHPDDLVDPIENVLVTVARCQPHEAALAVWESAMRSGLVDRGVLLRLDLPPAARRLCAEARPFADSGLETLFPTRLRWLKLPMLQQAWILGRPVDLLIGERLVVQIDGGHHVGAQRAADIEHDALLMLRGYHVIRVTYAQIVDDWATVQRLIAGAVSQGLHLARD
ncbi:endonuclease domain-containing protein [Microbacterium sp. bgisy189]|uniref:endonuclease domain-containing protein n=1 Tax=Microbacterium sp. bgisy189 TaxID=3413798 RepID=UPI003EC14733